MCCTLPTMSMYLEPKYFSTIWSSEKTRATAALDNEINLVGVQLEYWGLLLYLVNVHLCLKYFNKKSPFIYL